MTWTLKVRGASSQPMLSDFLCPNCGPCSALAPRDCDGIPCPDGCGEIAVWVMPAPFGRVNPVSFSTGRSDERPPGMLDTRPLAEGMSKAEWDKQQRKIDHDAVWKRGKEIIG